jgi:hypothetical protein
MRLNEEFGVGRNLALGRKLRPSSFAKFFYGSVSPSSDLPTFLQKGKIIFVSLFEFLDFLNRIFGTRILPKGLGTSRDSRRFCDANASNGYREKGKTRYNGRAAVGGRYCLRMPRKSL